MTLNSCDATPSVVASIMWATMMNRAKYTFALDYFLLSGHHRQSRFLFHQLRVVDLAGGIVQNHDEVIPALVLKPLMPAETIQSPLAVRELTILAKIFEMEYGWRKEKHKSHS